MKRITILITLTALLISPLSTMAQQGTWEKLGSRPVDFGLDRDEIRVTWRNGFFDAIKFEVRGGALNMHKVVVHFENGGVQEIETRHNFGRGDWSRTIDLKGNNRLIEKIVFWYDTKNVARRKAWITVFGHH